MFQGVMQVNIEKIIYSQFSFKPSLNCDTLLKVKDTKDGIATVAMHCTCSYALHMHGGCLLGSVRLLRETRTPNLTQKKLCALNCYGEAKLK